MLLPADLPDHPGAFPAEYPLLHFPEALFLPVFLMYLVSLDYPVLPAHLTSLEFLKSQIYFPVLLRPLPGHLPFQSL